MDYCDGNYIYIPHHNKDHIVMIKANGEKIAMHIAHSSSISISHPAYTYIAELGFGRKILPPVSGFGTQFFEIGIGRSVHF